MGTSTGGPATATNASGSDLKVIRPLGDDAVSEAFLASVPGFDTPKVVRLLKPTLAQNDATAELFIAEARRLMTVQHPALLAVHGAGRMRDGRVYAVTDYVEGGGLTPTVGHAVGPETLVEVGLQLSAAMAAVHAVGAVHGALDTRHVLLGVEGPRLDFTFASVERQGSASVAGDARALAKVLLAASAPDTGPGPLDSSLKATAQSAESTAALVTALESVRGRWKDHTAVSGRGQNPSPLAPSDPVEEPDLSGQTLGNYRVLSVLGEGAMGRVYRGTHATIGRAAAIKVLKAEHAKNRDLVQRFIQEAQAVNAIKNPHIVDVYDFGEERLPDGTARVYCIMELLEGTALADEMERAPMTLTLATRVCGELAQALGAAHQVGVVHRDVKPDNVFLTRREHDAHFVKVLDFGVAKLLKPIGDLPRSGTMAGVVIGTPEYMAPEQALGQGTDARVDVYAVGVVLYEILAGHRPYQGDTFGQLVVELTTTPLPPLPRVTPRGDPIPAGLRAVVNKCLEKNAEDRYANGSELAQALAAVDASRASPDAAAPHEELAAVRASRAPRVLAGLFGLALLAGLAVLLLPAAKPAAVVAPPVEAPTPPRPAAVVLDVKSLPTGAKVTRLDTQAVLGNTPFKTELARSAVELELEFELAGHQTVRRKVSLDANANLTVDLSPGGN